MRPAISIFATPRITLCRRWAQPAEAVPITVKFSQEFYDRLGRKVADELNDWFNTVDATDRSEFRELFELNFARFDAKLEQRLVEMKAERGREIADWRVDVRGNLAALESRLVRWMVGLWMGTTLTLIATMVALVRL